MDIRKEKLGIKLIRSKWFILSQYVVLFLLVTILIANKANYHVDELFSYGLSNCENTWAIKIEQLTKYTPADKPYLDYLAVKEGQAFNYPNVWLNQSHDVHPPLYYAILHTICSFFQGSFSVWYAGSINICFSLLTLFALRKLTMELVDDELTCNIVSLIYISSAGILSSFTFLRMYVMTTFLITITTYMFAKMIRSGTFTNKQFVCLLFITVLGAITHYYYIFYVVIISGLYGVLLLIEKNKRSVIRLIAYGFISGTVSLCIFPYMVLHFVYSDRGAESIRYLTHFDLNEYIERLMIFSRIVNNDVFGTLFPLIVLFMTLIVVALHIKNKNEDTLLLSKSDKNVYLIVAGTLFIYFVVITKIAAFTTARFMHPIYATLFAFVFGLLIKSFLVLFRKTKAIFVLPVLIALIIGSSWINADFNYLYRETLPLLNEAKKLNDTDCLFLYDQEWRTQPNFMEVKNYRSVTFIQKDNVDVEKLSLLDIADEQSLILLVTNDQERLIPLLQEAMPQLTAYEEIGTLFEGYATTYYFHQ